jgi:hypothetical protein
MKKYLITLWITFLLVSCSSPAVTISATDTPLVPVPKTPRTPLPSQGCVPGEIVLSHVTCIASEIGPRRTGSKEESKTAQYVFVSVLEGILTEYQVP